MGRHLNFLLASAVFFVTLLGFVGFQYFNSQKRTVPLDHSTSELALEDEAARLVGKPIDFASFSAAPGTPILFVYLEKSCNACKSELKRISAMEPTGRAPVIGLMQEDPGTIDAYKKANGIKFKVLQDSDGKIAEKLSIRYYPTNLLVMDAVIKKASFGSFASDQAFIEFVQGE